MKEHLSIIGLYPLCKQKGKVELNNTIFIHATLKNKCKKCKKCLLILIQIFNGERDYKEVKINENYINIEFEFYKSETVKKYYRKKFINNIIEKYKIDREELDYIIDWLYNELKWQLEKIDKQLNILQTMRFEGFTYEEIKIDQNKYDELNFERLTLLNIIDVLR